MSLMILSIAAVEGSFSGEDHAQFTCRGLRTVHLQRTVHLHTMGRTNHGLRERTTLMTQIQSYKKSKKKLPVGYQYLLIPGGQHLLQVLFGPLAEPGPTQTPTPTQKPPITANYTTHRTEKGEPNGGEGQFITSKGANQTEKG